MSQGVKTYVFDDFDECLHVLLDFALERHGRLQDGDFLAHSSDQFDRDGTTRGGILLRHIKCACTEVHLGRVEENLAWLRAVGKDVQQIGLGDEEVTRKRALATLEEVLERLLAHVELLHRKFERLDQPGNIA